MRTLGCAFLLMASGTVAISAALQCGLTVANDTCFPSVTGYDKTAAPTAAACCALCFAAGPGICQSYTWVPGSRQHECHLKPVVPADKGILCPGGVSGTMVPPSPPVPPPTPPTAGALNILFIVVDDLRPELGAAYGQRAPVTPHLDAFAASALTFERGFCQYSHCSPSRNSFMSGRRPPATAVYNFIDHFRLPRIGANWTALPQFFKDVHGYTARGGGKLYHPGHPPNDDRPFSWDAGPDGYFKANGDDHGCRANESIYNNVCPSAEGDDAFYDSVLADSAVVQLQKLANRSVTARTPLRPFFLGVGLRRPHRAWHVPRRFYDLYANNGTAPTNISLAAHRTWPQGTPELAYIDNAWPPIKMSGNAPIPDNIATLGRWGYYASVSFVDWNVGKVLTALKDNGFENNTVVLFTGDHGWELGEHGEWCKRTNWEVGLRVPYMIRSPRHAATSYGKTTRHLAESVDFYKTLAALALPEGAAAVETGVDGTDLSPVFVQPDLSPPLKTAAFSQMARCPAKGTLGPESACNNIERINIAYMGFSVRVDNWRYNAWLSFNGTTNRGDWEHVGPGMAPATIGQKGLLGEELYDHTGDDGTDFDAFENTNLAVDTQHSTTRDQLLLLLKQQFG